MFGSLFEEDGNDAVEQIVSNGKVGDYGRKALPAAPPPPRPRTNMCGIRNQGATCYLNSLLQTLLFTPEFRDGLFGLSREELGWTGSNNDSVSNKKLRVIPVELQKLFSHLLLADINAVSTSELTDSFGWVENEELQQHDVQELNRILFSAIEKSLVGTAGMDLISRLYRGTVVNQVECLECGRVSEREEGFFDLTVSVSGHTTLEGSLKSTYVTPEKMVGSNRYYCSHCDQLVDASKRTKLRRLPPILTLSLLRFSYNPMKGERFKDTSKFAFPVRLDLSPFCDGGGEPKDEPFRSNVFKLFSVVVHKGNAHGGHYHAYVRDVSNLGHWDNSATQVDSVNGVCVNGDKEKTKAPETMAKEEEAPGDVGDEKDLPFPAALLRDILQRGNYIAPSGTMSMVDLCCKLSELTCGSTWKETFQPKYGHLSQFLSSHPSLFYFDKVTGSVGLQPSGTMPLVHSRGSGTDSGGYKGGAHRRKKRKKKRGGGGMRGGGRKPRGGGGEGRRRGGTASGRRSISSGGCTSTGEDRMDGEDDDSEDASKYEDCSLSEGEDEMVAEGTHWFDFDDATVTAIPASALETQYSGRESAYMLFYRREELGSGRRRLPLVPEHLANLVMEKNRQLGKEREDYDRAVHEVFVRILPSGAYTVRNAGLHKRMTAGKNIVEDIRVSVDKRWTIRRLHQEILEACEKEPGWTEDGSCCWKELYTCQDTPCGLHLVKPLMSVEGSPDEMLVKDLVGKEDFRIFAWNGKEVGGSPYHAGPENEPIMLKLLLPPVNGVSHEISRGFPKSCPLSHIRVVIAELCALPLLTLYLSYEPPEDPKPRSYHLRRAGVANVGGASKLSNGLSKDTNGNDGEFTLAKPIRLSFSSNDQSLVSIGMVTGGKITISSKSVSVPSSLETSKLVVWVEDWTQIGLRANLMQRSMKTPSDSSSTESNGCAPVRWGAGGRLIRLEVPREMTIAHLKSIAVKQLGLTSDHLRLRKLDEEPMNGSHDVLSSRNMGFMCPLREALMLRELGVESGLRLILEEGQPVHGEQIWLVFSTSADVTESPREFEIVVDKRSTVRNLLSRMVSLALLTGEDWHIRRTKWNGDPGDPLDDLDSSLEKESLVHGDHLNLCRKALPSRGFLRLQLYMCSYSKELNCPTSFIEEPKVNGMDEHQCKPVNDTYNAKLLPQEEHKIPVLETSYHKLVDLGRIDINQESSLDELKMAIVDMCPAVSSLSLPSLHLLRLRLLRKVDNSSKSRECDPVRMRLSRVLRNNWTHLQGGGGRRDESDFPALSALQLHSGSAIVIQVLSDEEELGPHDVVLELFHRPLMTEDAPSPMELIWDNSANVSGKSAKSNACGEVNAKGRLDSQSEISETPLPEESSNGPSDPLADASIDTELTKNVSVSADYDSSESDPVDTFKRTISSRLGLSHSNVILAKYVTNKRYWLVFHDTSYQDRISCSPGWPKKRPVIEGPLPSSKSVRQYLTNLADGDVIAVKDLTCLEENEDMCDFQSFDSLLVKRSADKCYGNDKKRVNAQNNTQEQSCRNKPDNWDDPPKKSERGIHIQVGDYS